MDVTVLSQSQRRLNTLLFLLMLGVLPAIPWYVTIAIRYYDAALVLPDTEFLSHIAAPTPLSVAFYVGWFALQSLLAVVLPGRMEKGVPLEDGSTLDYKLNGLVSLSVTLLVVALLVSANVLPSTFLYDQLDALVTTTNLVVLGLCFVVYAIGRRQATAKERLLNPVEAYFVGAALNPRTGSFDWKFFCESRPGMILWVLIDLSFAAAQYARHGEVSVPMALVCAFQILYVTDYFIFEDAILTTWDIRHEPFGFMLCWGSLVWVPFTFSLQALYLVDHAFDLPTWGAALLIALNMLGYVIFRGANLQKHRFRKAPERPFWGFRPEFIQTRYGTKLLTSGFWGVARHSNYLGDLTMGLAWCMTTGFHAILPYFYFIYFVILLVHRERRDSNHCARKYGADWRTYTDKVRWRILPFVY